ncbi:hypothetical protein CAOG_002218 [Capsaspora owczarzaki ATCC 30864]|uniref:Uncharacterized protein n=2 Tax=Capsaspora owczarzaki (strain ATCC 30864) TaxID=595528 RepID=A0A0D2X1L4_CAPO3|nr:hypothetical protein CAOG_002218 [Capsaspora owczarzaki ATCC 30864]
MASAFASQGDELQSFLLFSTDADDDEDDADFALSYARLSSLATELNTTVKTSLQGNTLTLYALAVRSTYETLLASPWRSAAAVSPAATAAAASKHSAHTETDVLRYSATTFGPLLWDALTSRAHHEIHISFDMRERVQFLVALRNAFAAEISATLQLLQSAVDLHQLAAPSSQASSSLASALDGSLNSNNASVRPHGSASKSGLTSAAATSSSSSSSSSQPVPSENLASAIHTRRVDVLSRESLLAFNAALSKCKQIIDKISQHSELALCRSNTSCIVMLRRIFRARLVLSLRQNPASVLVHVHRFEAVCEVVLQQHYKSLLHPTCSPGPDSLTTQTPPLLSHSTLEQSLAFGMRRRRAFSLPSRSSSIAHELSAAPFTTADDARVNGKLVESPLPSAATALPNLPPSSSSSSSSFSPSSTPLHSVVVFSRESLLRRLNYAFDAAKGQQDFVARVEQTASLATHAVTADVRHHLSLIVRDMHPNHLPSMYASNAAYNAWKRRELKRATCILQQIDHLQRLRRGLGAQLVSSLWCPGAPDHSWFTGTLTVHVLDLVRDHAQGEDKLNLARRKVQRPAPDAVLPAIARDDDSNALTSGGIVPHFAGGDYVIDAPFPVRTVAIDLWNDDVLSDSSLLTRPFDPWHRHVLDKDDMLGRVSIDLTHPVFQQPRSQSGVVVGWFRIDAAASASSALRTATSSNPLTASSSSQFAATRPDLGDLEATSTGFATQAVAGLARLSIRFTREPLVTPSACVVAAHVASPIQPTTPAAPTAPSAPSARAETAGQAAATDDASKVNWITASGSWYDASHPFAAQTITLPPVASPVASIPLPPYASMFQQLASRMVESELEQRVREAELHDTAVLSVEQAESLALLRQQGRSYSQELLPGPASAPLSGRSTPPPSSQPPTLGHQRHASFGIIETTPTLSDSSGSLSFGGGGGGGPSTPDIFGGPTHNPLTLPLKARSKAVERQLSVEAPAGSSSSHRASLSTAPSGSTGSLKPPTNPSGRRASTVAALEQATTPTLPDTDDLVASVANVRQMFGHFPGPFSIHSLCLLEEFGARYGIGITARRLALLDALLGEHDRCGSVDTIVLQRIVEDILRDAGYECDLPVKVSPLTQPKLVAQTNPTRLTFPEVRKQSAAVNPLTPGEQEQFLNTLDQLVERLVDQITKYKYIFPTEEIATCAFSRTINCLTFVLSSSFYRLRHANPFEHHLNLMKQQNIAQEQSFRMFNAGATEVAGGLSYSPYFSRVKSPSSSTSKKQQAAGSPLARSGSSGNAPPLDDAASQSPAPSPSPLGMRPMPQHLMTQQRLFGTTESSADLLSLLTTCIERGAADNYVVMSAMAAPNDSLSSTVKKTAHVLVVKLVALCERIVEAVRRDLAFVPEIYGIDVAAIAAHLYLIRFTAELDVFFMSMPVESSSGMFDLYFALRDMRRQMTAMLRNSTIETLLDERMLLSEWFIPFVFRWIEQKGDKMLSWADSVLESDQLLHRSRTELQSTSVSDIFDNIQQNAGFLVRLDWVDHHMFVIFVARFAVCICRVLDLYSAALRRTVAKRLARKPDHILDINVMLGQWIQGHHHKQSKPDAAKRFQTQREVCVCLDNIEASRSHLQRFVSSILPTPSAPMVALGIHSAIVDELPVHEMFKEGVTALDRNMQAMVEMVAGEIHDSIWLMLTVATSTIPERQAIRESLVATSTLVAPPPPLSASSATPAPPAPVSATNASSHSSLPSVLTHVPTKAAAIVVAAVSKSGGTATSMLSKFAKKLVGGKEKDRDYFSIGIMEPGEEVDESEFHAILSPVADYLRTSLAQHHEHLFHKVFIEVLERLWSRFVTTCLAVLGVAPSGNLSNQQLPLVQVMLLRSLVAIVKPVFASEDNQRLTLAQLETPAFVTLTQALDLARKPSIAVMQVYQQAPRTDPICRMCLLVLKLRAGSDSAVADFLKHNDSASPTTQAPSFWETGLGAQIGAHISGSHSNRSSDGRHKP